MNKLPLQTEQEAQTIRIKSTKQLSFSNRTNQYRKHYLSDESIERANKPLNATERTSMIGDKAQAVVAIVRQKLSKSRQEWFMSDNYMKKTTKRKERQNRDIIGQINGTKFSVTRCRKRSHNSEKHCRI